MMVYKDLPEEQGLRISPDYFIHKVFGYLIEPHHANILQHIEENAITLDLAPRGFGKSRIATIGYASWIVCNVPNCRVLILSDTDTHAVRFLNTIKNILQTSPVIAKNYGKIVGDPWSDHQITTALRTDNSITEASITSLGMLSGAVTTGHYSHIFGDDLSNFANTRTSGQRERAKNFWKTTVLPTLLPGGEIHNLATRYHFADISDMWMKEMHYDTQIQPAILNEGTRKEESLWEAFYPLHTKTVNGRKVKGLKEIKEDVGSLIFGLQYMNDVSLQKSGTIFHYDWFNFYSETDLPKRLKVFQGVDLAISKKDTADYFVILTLGIDELGNVYILDIYRKRGLSFRSQVDTVIMKAEEWKPFKIGIEINAYQAALAQEVVRLTLLPIIELPTTKDKILRAQMRSGLVESGRVYVKTDMHSFISELTLLDAGAEHDDQFDGFDFGLTVAEMKGGEEAIQEGYYIPEFNPWGQIY